MHSFGNLSWVSWPKVHYRLLSVTGSCLKFVIELLCNWLILRMWCHLGEFIRSALALTLLCIHMHFISTSVSAHFEVNNVKISLSQISFSFVLQKKMHYYRYENAEVSCCYKYLMFSYNIIFWVSWWLMFCFSVNACIISHKHALICKSCINAHPSGFDIR